MIIIATEPIILTMKSLPETLPDETNALQKMVLDYQSTVDQLQEKLKFLVEHENLLCG